MELSPIQIRVLGSLMEKSRTTPEAYPLTLNTLVNACNQKTSRSPVTDLDDDEVLSALDSLREMSLVMRVDLAGSRTAKFRENLSAQWGLSSEEFALLAVLFLRGPQTPGQLRQRTERLYPFAELENVNACLQRLQSREEEPHCLVKPLEKSAGSKELRFAHTLIQEAELNNLPPTPVADDQPEPSAPTPPADRLGEIENKLTQLESRLAQMENLLNGLIE
jgi:uncharacterized protein YceH (UPF0502 family)